MKPVMDGYIFKTVANIILHSPQMYGATTLKYIHLQKSQKDSTDYKFNVRCIFPFAIAVAAHNQKVFHQMHKYKVTIEAQDAVCGNPNEEEWRTAYYDLLTNKDHNEINGLLRSLDAAVSGVYIVSCNLSTVDVEKQLHVIVEQLEFNFH